MVALPRPLSPQTGPDDGDAVGHGVGVAHGGLAGGDPTEHGGLGGWLESGKQRMRMPAWRAPTSTWTFSPGGKMSL